MRRFWVFALGIMSAVGGFVDIGDLVFASQAGAKFGYGMVWALALGTLGAIVFSEMAGRVSAVADKPIFTLVREMYPRPLGLVALTASLIVNLMTCAAEIGGVALIVGMLTALPYRPLVLGCAAVLIVAIWLLRFKYIERVFGYLGLGLLVFVPAMLMHVDWRALATGFIPGYGASADPLLYAYFAVGVLSATLMPYEIYFYSSGVVEEEWGDKDVAQNRLVAILGYSLGSLPVVGIMGVASVLLLPQAIDPQLITTTAMLPLATLGQAGLLLALLGMLFAVAGASIETSFSAAYSLSQYMGWAWGKRFKPRERPKFTASWLVTFVLGTAIIFSGIDPVQLTEYAVVFSVVLMPGTYLPLLLAGQDRRIMGPHANGPLSRSLGWAFFALVSIVAVAAVPLMIVTHLGAG